MQIDIKNITKKFAATEVLKSVNLTIASGEMVALLGASGSGKTTLLRIIAGLETATSGRILFGGNDVSTVSASERHIGFVFQNYALFRHMTVADNIAFGLTVKKRAGELSTDAVKSRVRELLAMVQLTDYAGRYPSQLSGGQQQRVALARALAVHPAVLLLDEPFGALDAQVREELRQWMRRLHAELKFTGIFVTHDQEEALEIADRVVVMSGGRIEQADPPEEIWMHPKTRFVLEFLCEVNRLKGVVRDDRLFVGNLSFPLTYPTADGPVDLLLRPIDAQLGRTVRDDGMSLTAKVLESRPRGGAVQVLLQPEGWYDTPIRAILLEEALPRNGEILTMRLDKAFLYRGQERLKAYIAEETLF